MMRRVAMLSGLVLAAALLGAGPPGKVLDLSAWKLTLPVDTDRSGTADEIRQPELDSFADPLCFFVEERADGVTFRARCDGRTTRGSNYPRCELREMTAEGTQPAAWDTAGRTAQTLTMRAAVTHTPRVKPHVVCAQIHDGKDDVMTVRLEGTKLLVERGSTGDVLLDRDYELGRPFELKIQAARGHVRLWYDGSLKMDWPVSRQGCYFKAGCYTQSNLDRGDAADAYGEVVVYRLRVGPGTGP